MSDVGFMVCWSMPRRWWRSLATWMWRSQSDADMATGGFILPSRVRPSTERWASRRSLVTLITA